MTPVAKAFLFDFDLTLADSADAIQFCAQSAIADMGLPVPGPKKVRESIGLTLHDTFGFLTGIEDTVLAESYATHYVSHADRVMVDMTTFYPAATQLLRKLSSLQVPVGIVSTKFRYRIQSILSKSGLTDCVSVIVGGEDVLRHKPDPEGILKALAAINVPPGEAVYVGDHRIDAQAAQAAGTQFIGTVTGELTAEAWEQLGHRSVKRGVDELAVLVA